MRRTLAAAVIAFSCVAETAAQPAGGSIFHYTRSNKDGTEPEHVVQFRPSRTEIAVYKWVEKCTTSAYVTATMDEKVREGIRFVAGRVARDGSQAQFGTLTLDANASTLAVDITPPGGERIALRHPLRARPYIIYDFDLADLNAFLQEHRPRASFTYEVPVIWPGDAGLFRDLGRLTASPAGVERRHGRRTVRFDLKIEGPSPSTGKLWIDARRGFIVEAELGLPNHREYKDFRLRLDRIQTGGRKAWNALTRGHYAGCPTGN